MTDDSQSADWRYSKVPGRLRVSDSVSPNFFAHKTDMRFAAAIASFGTVAQLGAFRDKTHRAAEMPI